MSQTMFCPDCEQEIPSDVFVAHREAEHPPATKVLVVEGIESQESVHGQAKE